VGGEPAAVWLRAHRRDLVDRALVELRAEPDYDREREDQLRWIIGHNVGLYVRMVDEPGFELDEAVAADLVASAANRAAEGSPIEALLRYYTRGTAAMWRAVAEHLGPDEQQHLMGLTDAVFRFLSSVTTLVVRGFQHEAAGTSTGERDARFAVYSALLSGTDPHHVAGRVGIPLAPRYLVLNLRLGATPDTGASGRSPRVPQWRRTNTVRRVLAEFASGDVLALLRDPVGTALLPLPPHPSTTEAADVRGLITTLSTALDAPVHAGVAIAEPDAVPAAAAVAKDVLDLVLAIERPAGAWFLDDVLVPYQLTRPGPARDLLVQRMRALDAHPDWELTLRTFLGNGYDRRLTAEALHVHPNTVDYRLGRIAEVCGIDAGDPAQRPAAFAAVHVRALDRRETD